jgi:aminopeptidase C
MPFGTFAEINIYSLEKVFQVVHHAQLGQNLDFKISMMSHAMDPQKVKCMIIKDLSSHSSSSTLENSHPINSKTKKFKGYALFCHPSPI